MTEQEKREVFDKWHKLINMSQKALNDWAKNEDRLLASINRQEAEEAGDIQSGYDSFHRIKRRKSKPFAKWSPDDFKNAKQEIGFNSRMLGSEPGQKIPNTSRSKWEISLRNWGHDPSLKSSPAYSKWNSWKKREDKKMKKEACVIALGELGGKRFMFKNRDRNYIPEIKIFHTRRNGVEVVYFRDELTGWCEGINEYGIAVANAALMVLWDEKEGVKGKKKDNSTLGIIGSKDADRILKTLECKTFDDALDRVVSYNNGVRGHTFVSDGDRAVSIEHTAKHRAYIQDLSWDDFHARSNHGLHYPKAGYTVGENKESSHQRMQTTLKTFSSCKTPEEFVSEIYRQRFKDPESPFNVVRKTDNMFTSSQVIYDFDKRKIILYLIPEDCDYMGHESTIEGKSKCSFEVKRLGYFDDKGNFDITPVRGNPVRVASLFKRLR